MKELLVYTLISIIWWTFGYKVGTEHRKPELLKSTSEISQDLEMACLSLWVGEQNKKWYEKHGK